MRKPCEEAFLLFTSIYILSGEKEEVSVNLLLLTTYFAPQIQGQEQGADTHSQHGTFPPNG